MDFRCQPFAFANAWIFFSRAVRGAVFTFSAGQQGSSRFSKIMQYFRLSRRPRTNLASSSCGLGARGPSSSMSWGGDGSTQEQSAEYANINTRYLHKLESGRRHLSLIVLCRFADGVRLPRGMRCMKGSTVSARGSEAVNGWTVTSNQGINTQFFRFDLVPCSWRGGMWPKNRDSGVHGLKRD